MVMPEDASLKNLAPPQPTTRLGIAAKNGDTEMVNTEIRISVVNEDNEAEKYTNSPIIWAADGGHTECVRAILEAGRNVNKQGYLGATAASRAARKGHAALLDLLLSNGADPEIPNLKLNFLYILLPSMGTKTAYKSFFDTKQAHGARSQRPHACPGHC